MTKRYVIRWKSKVNGRIGQGSRLFDRSEAEELVAELNAEYPDIEHQIADAPEPAAVEAKADASTEHALAE